MSRRYATVWYAIDYILTFTPRSGTIYTDSIYRRCKMATINRGRIYSPLLKELVLLPPVTESDFELIDRFSANDREAGHLLFVKHYKMVLKIVGDVTGGRWYDDDCMQAGAVGLYEAAKRFDKSLGYTFLTYAVPWIRKYVYIEVCNDALPSGGIYFSRDFRERLYRYIGFKVTGKSMEAIRDIMGVSERDARHLEEAAMTMSRPISMDGTSYDSEGEMVPDYELLGLPTYSSAEEEYEVGTVKANVEAAINQLDEQSQYILNRMLKLNGAEHRNRKELIAELGVSATTFDRQKRDAYRGLRKKLIRER